MKHSKMTSAFARVLIALAGFAAGLAGALPARGADVPFREHVISITPGQVNSVFATDVDLDGDGDIDVLSAEAGKIAWYESDNALHPSFTEHMIGTVTNGKSVFATDLDGDGDIDVLSTGVNVCPGDPCTLVWFENRAGNGGLPPSYGHWEIPTNARAGASVFAVDLDGDGDIDVLTAALNGDHIAWYENDGDPEVPHFPEHVISTTAFDARSVFATDVDGDGDIDVLSASVGSFKLAWYENNPAVIPDDPPTFTERVISEGTDVFTSVYATDLDCDGHTDVLSGAHIGGKIAWWKSDGGSPPTFTERVISTGTNGNVSVFAIDVDGDGDTDVLSASVGDGKIAWYENDGGSPPTFTEHVISTTAADARSVFATDLDGDGDIDVLSASDRKIAWYENTFVDFDADGDVDLRDFSRFLGTFGDLDADGDVGLLDFSRFLDVFMGPATP